MSNTAQIEKLKKECETLMEWIKSSSDYQSQTFKEKVRLYKDKQYQINELELTN